MDPRDALERIYLRRRARILGGAALVAGFVVLAAIALPSGGRARGQLAFPFTQLDGLTLVLACWAFGLAVYLAARFAVRAPLAARPEAPSSDHAIRLVLRERIEMMERASLAWPMAGAVLLGPATLHLFSHLLHHYRPHSQHWMVLRIVYIFLPGHLLSAAAIVWLAGVIASREPGPEPRTAGLGRRFVLAATLGGAVAMVGPSLGAAMLACATALCLLPVLSLARLADRERWQAQRAAPHAAVLADEDRRLLVDIARSKASPATRIAAFRVAADRIPSADAARIAEALLTDPSRRIRRAVGACWLELDGTAAAIELERALTAGDAGITALAVRQLHRREGEDVERMLRLMLHRPTPAVRAEAARALGVVGTAHSIPALSELTRRSRRGSRDHRQATRALARLRARVPDAEPGWLSLREDGEGALALAPAEEGALTLAGDLRDRIDQPATAEQRRIALHLE